MRDPRTYAIIGAAIDVHNELGTGFLEAVYQDALAIELKLRDVPFEREVGMVVHYKQHTLQAAYRADFVCYQSVIVETKAIDALTSQHESQLLNYLKGTGMQVGMLINFGAPSLQHKRMIRTI